MEHPSGMSVPEQTAARAIKSGRPKTLDDTLTDAATKLLVSRHQSRLTRVHILIAIAEQTTSPGGALLNELGLTAAKLTNAAVYTVWIKSTFLKSSAVIVDEEVGGAIYFAEKVANVLGQELSDLHILLGLLYLKGNMGIRIVLTRAKASSRYILKRIAVKIGVPHEALEIAIREAEKTARQ